MFESLFIWIILGVTGSIFAYFTAKNYADSQSVGMIYSALFFLVLFINSILLSGPFKIFLVIICLGSGLANIGLVIALIISSIKKK